MNIYFRSSLYVAGMALCVNLSGACSSGRPLPPSVPKQYSGDISNENSSAAEDSNADDKQPVQVPDGQGAPGNRGLSVSVSLSPIPSATQGNSSFPRALNLGNSTLLLTYNQDIDGFRVLKTEISRDDGLTWQEHGEIAREPISETRVLSETNLINLPSGGILAIFRNHNDGIFRILTTVSTDGGKSWAFQGEVDVNAGAEGRNMFHPVMSVNSKGEIQAFYSKEKSLNGDVSIVMRTSSDEGKFWKNETIVAARAVGNAAFPGVVRLKDGSILVVFDTPRSDSDTHLVMQSTQSNNDGLTWSSPKDVYIPLNGQRSAKSPQVALLEDGRPLVFFMTDEDGAEDECCSIKMMLGKDVGSFDNLQWVPQPITAITGNTSIFPSGILASDGDFMLFYEKAGKTLSNRVSIEGGL